MGMDLYRITDGAYFRWGGPYWLAVLELAQRNGWQPMGTRNPCRSEWDGNYTLNASQVVVDQDAMEMAMALEKGLPDIPSEDATVHKRRDVDWKQAVVAPIVRVNSYSEISRLSDLLDAEMLIGAGFTSETWKRMNCFEKLAGAQTKLKDFIAYLREGAFEIH
ncbi:hypothetical protein ACFL5Z_04830 [Planctomycetota bacterium]